LGCVGCIGGWKGRVRKESRLDSGGFCCRNARPIFNIVPQSTRILDVERAVFGMVFREIDDRAVVADSLDLDVSDEKRVCTKKQPNRSSDTLFLHENCEQSKSWGEKGRKHRIGKRRVGKRCLFSHCVLDVE
jgi:hypothetical protein